MQDGHTTCLNIAEKQYVDSTGLGSRKVFCEFHIDSFLFLCGIIHYLFQ